MFSPLSRKISKFAATVDQPYVVEKAYRPALPNSGKTQSDKGVDQKGRKDSNVVDGEITGIELNQGLVNFQSPELLGYRTMTAMPHKVT